jgi:hypothetical protein
MANFARHFFKKKTAKNFREKMKPCHHGMKPYNEALPLHFKTPANAILITLAHHQ